MPAHRPLPSNAGRRPAVSPKGVAGRARRKPGRRSGHVRRTTPSADKTICKGCAYGYFVEGMAPGSLGMEFPGGAAIGSRRRRTVFGLAWRASWNPGRSNIRVRWRARDLKANTCREAEVLLTISLQERRCCVATSGASTLRTTRAPRASGSRRQPCSVCGSSGRPMHWIIGFANESGDPMACLCGDVGIPLLGRTQTWVRAGR